MSRSEHRAQEPDDSTAELPRVPPTPEGDRDPLDPAPLAWSAGADPTTSEPSASPFEPPGPGAPPSELSDVSFPTAWRGYEPTAVDAYVRQVTRTIADLEGNRSPAEAVRRALDRVGEETSSILHEAEQAAERMTEKSRKQASERLEQAEREADEITLAARTRLRQLDADVDRIWLERQRLIDDTRRLAERLVQISDRAEERFPAEDEETTVSEESTVSDALRAPPGAEDTVRFSPPGIIDSEPSTSDGPAAAGKPSPSDGEHTSDSTIPGQSDPPSGSAPASGLPPASAWAESFPPNAPPESDPPAESDAREEDNAAPAEEAAARQWSDLPSQSDDAAGGASERLISWSASESEPSATAHDEPTAPSGHQETED